MGSRFVIHETSIQGVMLIDVLPIVDERGSFFRVYCEKEFSEKGMSSNFVQINQSINLKKGTFRGLHYQKGPYGEDKMVKCIRGSIKDYFLDLRKDSSTFMQYGMIELSEDNHRMIYLPKGIAHGFTTLEDNTHLMYYHTQFFVPEAQATINHADPKVELDLSETIRFVSPKDKNAPFLPDDFSGF